MFKVKHERECDCVVAGFRWHKGGNGTAVGSLLLGLYDDEGASSTSASAASFTDGRSAASWWRFLAPYRERRARGSPVARLGGWRARTRRDGAGPAHAGGKSRWSQGKDLSWEPLRPELVVRGRLRPHAGPRFRHTAQFRRWRPDKSRRATAPTRSSRSCAPQELATIFATRS